MVDARPRTTAVAARTRYGVSTEDEEGVAEAIRRLSRQELDASAMLALTQELLAPFARTHEAHPVPALVDMFFDATGALREWTRRASAELQPSESGAGMDVSCRRWRMQAVTGSAAVGVERDV